MLCAPKVDKRNTDPLYLRKMDRGANGAFYSNRWMTFSKTFCIAKGCTKFVVQQCSYL